MLLFGHVGITLASAALSLQLKDRFSRGTVAGGVKGSVSPGESYSSNEQASGKPSFFRLLANRMDIRFLLVGSMLPDIIDKPMGIYIFREILGSGRVFSHTLLFLIIVIVAGLMIKRYSGKAWGLALSLGMLLHLILDQMWQMPETLFWPIFGTGFEKAEITQGLGNWLLTLLIRPEYYVPEIIGFIIFTWFAWELLHRRAIAKFLKHGFVA